MLFAAAAVTGFAVYEQSDVSDLLNANVEALARYEIGPVVIECSDYGCEKCYREENDGIRYWCEWEGLTIYYCKFC